MAMSLVILTQCLVFADGGISVLGANVLNMALIASLPAVLVRECFTATSYKKTAYFAAAFVSTILAAAACAFQLAIAGAAPLQSVLPAMLSVHALIALAEAGLTVALLTVLAHAATRVAPQRAWIMPLGIATIVAVMISPFASALPDGLESVAATLGFEHLSGTLFAAPFADYAVSAAGVFSTALAGLIGITMLFAIAYGTGQAFIWSAKRVD
jgi:cobalt/nickel transport system permease protein